MGRKAFEEKPYDPIAADLARDVAAAGRGSPAISSVAPRVVQRPQTLQHSTVASFPAIESAAREATITKRFVLTRTEDDDLNEFLLRLQKQVGTKVPLSVVVRAALTVLMQAESQVMDEIRGWPIRFPSTHDCLGQNTFEAEWIRCLGRAIRRSPSPTPLPGRPPP